MTEYILIIAFVLSLYFFANNPSIKKLRLKYFLIISLIVYPAFLFFIVLPHFTITKLLVFVAMVALGVGDYYFQKRILNQKEAKI